MEKRFSTVRDTQRGLQSYMEKRRGRRDIEVTRRIRGGIKRGENNLANNHTPKSMSTEDWILKVTKLVSQSVSSVN